MNTYPFVSTINFPNLAKPPVGEQLPDWRQEKQRESRRLLRKSLLREFRRFAETGNYSVQDYGNARYDYLDSLGLIPFDNQQKRVFWKEARESELRKASGQTKDANRDAVVLLAKKLALRRYFEQLRSQGANLEALIDEATHRSSRQVA